MACSDKLGQGVRLPRLHTRSIYTDQSWPGELAPVPLSMGLPIVYRARPERSAPVLGTLHLPRGAPLCSGSDPGVVYRSFAPVRLVWTAPMTLDLTPLLTAGAKPRRDEDHRHAYVQHRGDLLEVVKYEGEGASIARIGGKFYEFPQPFDLVKDPVVPYKVIDRGRDEVWFEVSAPGSGTRRWVLNDPQVLTIDEHG